VTWTDVAEDESDFGQLGADFDATGAIRIGRVAAATAKLMRQRAVVDFAVDWIARNRAPKS
jgi:aminoglycoside 3-N-acetyltransferase